MRFWRHFNQFFPNLFKTLISSYELNYDTEVGALFLLISGARMKILLSLPSKNKAHATVVSRNFYFLGLHPG